MIVLRLLSLLVGGLILVVPPLFLVAGDAKPEFFDGRTVVGVQAAAVLVAAAFAFIGVAGERMRKSAPLRALGALLLAVPFTGGVAVLLRTDDPTQLWLSAALVCVAVVLFVAFVIPTTGPGRQRPMRRREQREPTLGRRAAGKPAA